MRTSPMLRETSADSPDPRRVYAALALAVTTASFASLLIRWAQPYAPSLVIAAYRLAIAAALLWPVLLVQRRRQPERWRPADVGLTVVSGLFLALHFGTWITSLAYTSVASSAVLVATAPLFVALLSPVALGEQVPARLFGGLALGLLGILTIGASDLCVAVWPPQCSPAAGLLGSQAVQGDLLALCGAAAGAGYLLIGRSLRHRVSLLPYITLTYSAAAVGLILAAALRGLPLFGYPAIALGLFTLLAVFPQLIAHSTYNWALRHLPAAPVALTLLAEPVAATVLAAVLLRERPDSMELLGVALILGGIWLGARASAQTGTAAQPRE